MKLLAFLCLLFSHQFSSAGEFQIELGQCRFGQSPDGTLYEKKYGYQNYLTPRCLSLGYASQIGHSAWGWRVAYIQAGRIEARDNMARFGDNEKEQPCDPISNKGCLARFNGYGNMRGVSGSLTYTQRVGAISLIPEAGFLAFQSNFHATAYSWESGTGVGDYHCETEWTAPPAPFFGVALRYKNAYVAMRYYGAAQHRCLSLTDHSFTQLVTGVAF